MVLRRNTVVSRILAVSLIAIFAVGCTASASFGTKEPEATAPAEDPAATAEVEQATAPDAKKPSRSGVRQSGDRLRLAGPVNFETGSANITSDSEATLEDLRIFLTERPKITKLRIEGHTDNVGKKEDNLKLSGERARAVKTWLVNKGISSSRLTAWGYGDEKPVAPNTTDANKAQNRRVEYVIIEIDGKAWRGHSAAENGGTSFD